MGSSVVKIGFIRHIIWNLSNFSIPEAEKLPFDSANVLYISDCTVKKCLLPVFCGYSIEKYGYSTVIPQKSSVISWKFRRKVWLCSEFRIGKGLHSIRNIVVYIPAGNKF